MQQDLSSFSHPMDEQKQDSQVAGKTQSPLPAGPITLNPNPENGKAKPTGTGHCKETVYSHSRLSTFEQCRLKFRLSYIDKVEPEVENTVEAFLGSMVHKALEKLYTDLKFKKTLTKQELVDFFLSEWEHGWDESIAIIRPDYGPENYKKMGETMLSEYYARHNPFDADRTIALEHRIEIRVGQKGRRIQGYIDRLAYEGNGVYAVHDYKTSSHLMTQEEADSDRQLALYSIGVKQDYPDCTKVKLVWHYLAFDKDVMCSRTDEQLSALMEEVAGLIDEVEQERAFLPTMSALCGWCGFKPYCPNFRHEYSLKENPAHSDDGVALVDEYVHLSRRKQEAEQALEKAKDTLMAFSERHGYSMVIGSKNKAVIKRYPRLSFPKKDDPRYKDFIAAIRALGLWERIGTADTYELAKLLNNGCVHPELAAVLEQFIERGTTDRIYLWEK